MRLIDFNISTADLKGTQLISVEINHQIFPVSELKIGPEGQIILSSNTTLKPLQLNQFQARVASLDAHQHLYYEEPANRLFGYRIVKNTILLG